MKDETIQDHQQKQIDKLIKHCKALEITLFTLSAWLVRELGEQGVKQLYDIYNNSLEPKQ